MDQGCINEGKDHRLLGRVVCWLQRKLSFAAKLPPVVVKLELPLGIRVAFPWPGEKYLMFRLALWRYDAFATPPTYIFFSGALKFVAPSTQI